MDAKTNDGVPVDPAGLYKRSVFVRKLLDSSPDGIVSAAMNGRILLFSRGAEQILGYGREETIASVNVARLYTRGMAVEILARMRSAEFGGKGSLSRQEITCVTKEGDLVPVSLTGGIIFSESGKEVATFGIFRDLRPIRKMQDRLLQSEKMASLGRMAAGVAHELNNPLSGIMMYAGLLLEKNGIYPAMAEDLHVIMNEAERCRQIVADLLNFSQPTTGRSEPVNLNDTISQTMETLEKNTDFTDIVVKLQMDPDLPPVLGDPLRLKQVFTNIFLNAVQVMRGRGKLVIGTRLRARGNMVEAFVSDNGPGIAEDIQSRIFDPFFTTKADTGGTGLGLSVAYGIVKENRGSIRVKSEKGSGATFEIRFPAIGINGREKLFNSGEEVCRGQEEDSVGG